MVESCITETVNKELPPKKDEPNKVAVEEEVIRAREDRYMAKEKRRQIFCMLTKPRTARCEFGEEPAEDQYDDIQAVNDIKRFIITSQTVGSSNSYTNTGIWVSRILSYLNTCSSTL